MIARMRSATTSYPRTFWVLFWGLLINSIGGSMVWPFLTIYMRQRLGVPLTTVTLLFTLNSAAGLAAMSIAGPAVDRFGYAVTRWSQRYPPVRVLALGALFYAVGAGSVALGHGFWTFWLSMVVLTCGELLLAPTGTALAANLAPADMRGRYMGLYGITWGASFGIGPVIGGLLNDNVAPVAIWIFGLAIGLAATLGFLLLGRRLSERAGYQGHIGPPNEFGV